MTSPSGTPGGRFISYAGKKQPPDQAQRRKNILVKDQHGRLVHLVWDTSCNGVVAIYPQFQAPWMPHLKYLHTHAEQGFPISVEWVYVTAPAGWIGTTMIEDNRSAWQMFYDNLLRFAGRMPGVSAKDAYQAAIEKRWDEVPKALLKECGVTPEPEEFIKAAMAGNKWVLGFSTVVPEWAGPFLAFQEKMRAEMSRPITDEELDRFRDADEDAPDMDDAFEQQFDAEALGGKRVPVASVKTPNSRVTKTRKEVVRDDAS